MQEVFEKIIEKLEEQKKGNPFVYGKNDKSRDASVSRQTLDYAIEIVKQEAERYNESLMAELLETKKNCGEDSDCSDCIFGHTEDRCYLQELQIGNYNNSWIPVEEELPKDGDSRYYMCIVENHEEDPPMYCQYDEECGFGFYKDIYDEHTLGFVDCEFNTNEELGYEKVIAWQQLLPYQPKGE